MNWKNTVSKLNTKHYSFPQGWDTREKIAEQLECSTDRVDTLLAPGLKSGEIEKQQFPVWDERLNRKMLVWGYRLRPDSPDTSVELDEETLAAVKKVIARHSGKTPGAIRDCVPKSIRHSVTTAQIRQIMEQG